jgi:hypothetical protein
MPRADMHICSADTITNTPSFCADSLIASLFVVLDALVFKIAWHIFPLFVLICLIEPLIHLMGDTLSIHHQKMAICDVHKMT